MHHKFVGGRLGGGYRQNGFGISHYSKRMLGGFGDYYDSDEEGNMVNVGHDHIPLAPGLSHVFRLELGSDPMLLGLERKISVADDSDEDSSSTLSCESDSSFLHRGDEPVAIRPLYKEEPTVAMEQSNSNMLALQQTNAPIMYNTTESKDVLQLKLAMQKQTEFDDFYRDMDHRNHCLTIPNHLVTPIPSRKRSRSTSPVIAVAPEIRQMERKLKSTPAPVATSPTATTTAGCAATATASNLSTPGSSRPSVMLLKSAYVRRPHKNRRHVADVQSTRASRKAEKQTPDKATNSSKKPSPLTTKSPNLFEVDDSEADIRFKRFQNSQWSHKFQELLDFKADNGHCQVPHTWPPNPQLARWVKRQRYQFKLRCESKLSTMTEDRIQLLEEAGFVWDSHAAAWQEKFEELKDYVNKNKTFNMGQSHSTHPQLATWVKCQRRQYKLLMAGEESNMTPERQDLLEKLGFLWGVRTFKK